MQTSKIVEVDGVFIGAAVLLPESQGWRFVAADHRADAADGRTAPTLNDARQLAKKAFFTSRSHALAPPAEQTADSAIFPIPPATGLPARA
jgi:hypothetical protein